MGNHGKLQEFTKRIKSATCLELGGMDGVRLCRTLWATGRDKGKARTFPGLEVLSDLLIPVPIT